MYPVLIGDSIFVPNHVVRRRVGAPKVSLQDVIDARMNSMYQQIELAYGLFFKLFDLFRIATHFKLLKSGEKAFCTMVVVLFLI